MVDHDAIIRRSAAILSEQQWDQLDRVFTDDVVQVYPQSGETFRGLDAVRASFANYPDMPPGNIDASSLRIAAEDQRWVDTPMFMPVRVEGSGMTGTAVFRVRYPDQSMWWVVLMYQLRGEQIRHAELYFAPEFEPADWRAPFREPADRS